MSKKLVTEESLNTMTAKEIVKFTFERTGVNLTIPIKDKKRVIKNALATIEDYEEAKNASQELEDVLKDNNIQTVEVTSEMAENYLKNKEVEKDFNNLITIDSALPKGLILDEFERLFGPTFISKNLFWKRRKRLISQLKEVAKERNLNVDFI